VWRVANGLKNIVGFHGALRLGVNLGRKRLKEEHCGALR